MSNEVTSNLMFRNTETNVLAILTPSSLDFPKDITVAFNPTTDYMMTEERLKVYIDKVNAYLLAPTIDKTIYQPTIDTLVMDGYYLNIGLSSFKSDILLDHVCTEYEISTTNNFSNVVLRDFVYNNKTDLSINMGSLINKAIYYIRIRYGGGGFNSKWSDAGEFTVNKPTLQVPTINPQYNIVYTDTYPYKVSITFTSSVVSNHTATTWNIYRKTTDGLLERVYTISKSTTDLNELTLDSIFPDTLKYDTEYYITAQYFYNEEYSPESTPIKFLVDGIKLKSVDGVKSYPPIINIQQPTFSFTSDFIMYYKNIEQTLPASDILSINWRINKKDTSIVLFSQDTIDKYVNIPSGLLLPNTSYTLSITYTHKTLGVSPVFVYDFTTTAFVNTTDGLSSPIKVIGDIGYYGEVETSNLMLEGVRYRGIYNQSLSYKQYDEVSYNGELYICTKDTPTTYTFASYFKLVDNTYNNYYKSMLPTPTWLIKNIGLHPSLASNDPANVDVNIINKNSGWVKFQNKHNQIIYVSKLPIYSNVSVNDLIKADLFHPRRKTIRIGNKLYYVRTLVSKLDVGYDSIYNNPNYNYTYSNYKEPVEYNEDKLLLYLLNGDISYLNPVDLDMDTSLYKELIYSNDKLESYRPEVVDSKYEFLGKELSSPTDRTLVFRPVLELIPEEEYPVLNISDKIPGNNTVNPDNYDKYLDMAYLGFVDKEEFLSSNDIDNRTGMNSGRAIENGGWFKFYYRGLIYFISYGLNFRNITYNKLNEFNLIYPTTLYKDNNTNLKYGKVTYNNRIYNVCLPSVLNYKDVNEITNVNGAQINILSNKDVDTNLSYNSLFSDTMYSIMKPVKTDKGLAGYKGSYKNIDFEDILSSLVNVDDDTINILTSNTTKTEKIIVNNNLNYNNISSVYNTTESDAIIILNINPTLDKLKLWKK